MITYYKFIEHIDKKRRLPVALAVVLGSKLSYTDLALSCPLKAIINSRRPNCHDVPFIVFELADLNLNGSQSTNIRIPTLILLFV